MIILASTSPTRQAMLSNAGVKFTAASPHVDERLLILQNPHWPPEDVSMKLAEAKALDVSRHHPQALVIGADQVLALGHKVFSKPTDIDDCRSQLRELRGQSHQLISSVVCARQGVTVWSLADVATLTMRAFSDDFLESYLGTNGAYCMKSVGGYQIEGQGIQLFSSVAGDYFTILGLPLLPLLEHLRKQGELAS